MTLMELMVVIGIIAILLMMAVPAYMNMLPFLETKADAKAVVIAMQRTKMAAANSQKPARLLLDCTNTARANNSPCRIQTQLAVYDSTGAIVSWRTIISGTVELHRNVMAVYASAEAKPMAQYKLFANFFKNFKDVNGNAVAEYGVEAPSTNANGSLSFVVAFLPGGEAVTAWANLGIDFVARQFNYDKGRLCWRLTVNNSTGRINLRRQN